MRRLLTRILYHDYEAEVLVASRYWLRRHFLRGFRSASTRAIGRYFLDHDVRKLLLGCGENVLDGWLNTDVFWWGRRNVRYLDAARRFPFGDEYRFDYVFSEHQIEHFPLSIGLAMLEECFRILKPGGKIRITTPDLRFLIGICREDKSAIEKEYVDWVVNRSAFPPRSAIEREYADWVANRSALPPRLRSVPSDAFVVNRFMRDCGGHQFIYDEKTLSLALLTAGFSDVARCALNESGDDALRGIEHESRLPRGYLALESMTLEATK